MAEALAMDIDMSAMDMGGMQQEAAGQLEPPARRLQRLEAKAAQLASQQAEVRAELAARANAAAAAAMAEEDGGWGAAAQSGIALPVDLPGLAAELTALTAGCTAVQRLQELQGLNRHAEGLLRRVESVSATPEAWFPAVEQAVSAYESAAMQATPLGDASAIAQAWLLSGHVEQELARTFAVRDALYGSLLAALQLRLAEVGWPPPIATSEDPTANQGSAASPADARSAAKVFGKSRPQLLTELQQLLAAMFALQKADNPDAFAKLGTGEAEGPPLWGVAELAAPIVARLRRHFAGNLPTDRADRPEWLFATAVRLASDLSPSLAPLQPAVVAAELGPGYAIQFEFARAVREGVKALLREHLLPRLVTEGAAASALWTHFAASAAAFEREMAPVRGVAISGADFGEGGELLPGLASEEGCLTVIFEDQEWREAWLAAERDEALETAEEAFEAREGWRPAAAAWGSMDLDLDEPVSSSSATAHSEAWREEFWPSVTAEALLGIVSSSVQRAAWLPSPQQRRQFVSAVPQEVLKGVRARLGRAAAQAEDYKDIAGSEWGPRVGAWVCAAHFLEHHLREGPDPLLLLDLQASETAVSSEDVARANGRRRSGPFDREASQFGTFRREWALKLAKALAASFTRDTKGYRLNLDAFASSQEGEEGEVSQRLAPAVTSAAQGLALLSGHLDAVVFRDVWRAFAVALNRLLYNDVATEAAFSPQGGAQFARDVAAVAALLAPYTPRPAAHFRELLDASKLLALPAEQASEVADALDQAPDAGLAAVRAAGANRLTAEQARRVLSQRL